MKTTEEELHIGNVIKEVLKEKDIKMAWLARKVSCEESNFCKKLKNNVITKELLYSISNVLRVDFFAYYSNDLNEKWKKNPEK